MKLIKWLLIGGAVMGAIGFIAGSKDDKADVQPPTASASNDLASNADFLAKNPQYLQGIKQLISLRGYECAQVSKLWARGMSAYGSKLEALCGPLGTTDSYAAQHYAVYPDKLKVNVCKPFSVSSPDCE
jgi:hypothetical protein